jgi:hypothetical protein
MKLHNGPSKGFLIWLKKFSMDGPSKGFLIWLKKFSMDGPSKDSSFLSGPHLVPIQYGHHGI